MAPMSVSGLCGCPSLFTWISVPRSPLYSRPEQTKVNPNGLYNCRGMQPTNEAVDAVTPVLLTRDQVGETIADFLKSDKSACITQTALLACHCANCKCLDVVCNLRYHKIRLEGARSAARTYAMTLEELIQPALEQSHAGDCELARQSLRKQSNTRTNASAFQKRSTNTLNTRDRAV